MHQQNGPRKTEGRVGLGRRSALTARDVGGGKRLLGQTPRPHDRRNGDAERYDGIDHGCSNTLRGIHSLLSTTQPTALARAIARVARKSGTVTDRSMTGSNCAGMGHYLNRKRLTWNAYSSDAPQGHGPISAWPPWPK